MPFGRISYRKVLPAAQLLVYCALVWFGCPYVFMWKNWLASTGTWDAGWIDGPHSLLEQLAMGINFPLMSLLFLFQLLDECLGLRTGSSIELVQHVGTAAAVPILWWWIGSRLDRRKLLTPASQTRRLLRQVCTILLVALAAVLLASLFLKGEMIVLRLAALVWCSVGIFSLRTRRMPE